jgi:GH15 family glucan-1,4-alpha-glucosidase
MQYYGLLSNSHTAALVSPEASVDWLPFPRFDSPAVFAKLIGADRNGYFAIRPTVPYAADQHYIDDTNILVTRFTAQPAAGGAVGAPGEATVTDYLAVGSQELHRVVKTDLPMELVIRPVFENGLIAAGLVLTSSGAMYQDPINGQSLQLMLTGDGARYIPSTDSWSLDPGEYDVRLIHHPDSHSLELDVDPDAEAREGLKRNVQYWRRLARTPYHGRFVGELKRSLLVLHGLTFRTNGAIIAAPTTSLPEQVGGERQWDYRFAWVRDGCYAAEALLSAGETVAARRIIDFFINTVDLQGKPFKAPFFRVDGTLIRYERDLNWLNGFRGSRPVRDGNAATSQLQLDIEGALVWAMWRYYLACGDREWLSSYIDALESILDWVESHWQQKDCCLWEFRGQDDHYTHSKVMCWVSLEYGARLVAQAGRPAAADRYRRAAERVREAVERHGFNHKLGIYTQRYEGDTVDAALLTLPLYGFVAADDPKFLATLARMEQDLVEHPWVYRYRSDMMGEAAHPFILASYWLARVYLRLNRRADAERLLVDLFKHTTDLGLLGEHVDVETNEPRGNFPQGFSHLGAILSILELAEHAKA